MRAFRFGMTWLWRLSLVAVAVAALAVAAPPLAGYKTLTVLSGSMSPAIETGDVVVDAQIAPRDARPGDVVTFTDPANRERLITHRVESVRVEGPLASFVTRGDANNTTERWSVPANGKIGRVAYSVPKAGYALAWMRTPGGKLLLLVLPALLWAVLELVRIWRPREKGVAHEAVA